MTLLRILFKPFMNFLKSLETVRKSLVRPKQNLLEVRLFEAWCHSQRYVDKSYDRLRQLI